jgi:type IV pilus assembly protein PilO
MSDIVQRLLDRFFELENRQRLLACVMAVALVFGGYWYLAYSPRSGELASLRTTVENLREQRDSKLKLIANLAATRDAVRELTAEVRRAEVRLPDQKEIPDLLSNVSSAVRESGLEIMLFRQKAERYHDFYAEVPVEILVRGNYHQVATFFDRVSQLDRIVNVGDISMRTPREQSSTMILDTSCSAVTFRFLDETERKRLAEQKAREKDAKRHGK